MKQILLLAIFAVGMVGCSSDFPLSPTGPTAPPVTGPPSTQLGGLRGGVADSAYRPLAGARVEVMNGPQAGQFTMADPSGAYALPGPFDEGTQFRATKDGYSAVVKALRVNVNCPACSGWFLFFALDVPTPPVNLAGDYTLTLTADRACELPSDVRVRTYPAALRPVERPDGSASTSFNVTFPGTAFLDDLSSFQIHVAGHYASFNLEESHGPWLVEQVAANTYLSIGGMAEASVHPAMSRISTSLEGTIGYCESAVAIAGFYSCSRPIVAASCASKNHQLALDRR